MAMMDRAVGPERMKVLRSQFRVWERCGGDRRTAAADAGANVLPALAGCAEWLCWFSSRSPRCPHGFSCSRKKVNNHETPIPIPIPIPHRHLPRLCRLTLERTGSQTPRPASTPILHPGGDREAKGADQDRANHRAGLVGHAGQRKNHRRTQSRLPDDRRETFCRQGAGHSGSAAMERQHAVEARSAVARRIGDGKELLRSRGGVRFHLRCADPGGAHNPREPDCGSWHFAHAGRLGSGWEAHPRPGLDGPQLVERLRIRRGHGGPGRDG